MERLELIKKLETYGKLANVPKNVYIISIIDPNSEPILIDSARTCQIELAAKSKLSFEDAWKVYSFLSNKMDPTIKVTKPPDTELWIQSEEGMERAGGIYAYAKFHFIGYVDLDYTDRVNVTVTAPNTNLTQQLMAIWTFLDNFKTIKLEKLLNKKK